MESRPEIIPTGTNEEEASPGSPLKEQLIRD
jgi:hypothetical protein